jgi:hypothetical protein
MVASVGSLNPFRKTVHQPHCIHIHSHRVMLCLLGCCLHCRDNYDQVLTSPNSMVEVWQKTKGPTLPCACQQLRFCGCLPMLPRICNLHHGHGIWRYYLLRAQILFPLNDSDSQARLSNKAAAANALPKAPAFLRIGASAELT